MDRLRLKGKTITIDYDGLANNIIKSNLRDDYNPTNGEILETVDENEIYSRNPSRMAIREVKTPPRGTDSKSQSLKRLSEGNLEDYATKDYDPKLKDNSKDESPISVGDLVNPEGNMKVNKESMSTPELIVEQSKGQSYSQNTINKNEDISEDQNIDNKEPLSRLKFDDIGGEETIRIQD